MCLHAFFNKFLFISCCQFQISWTHALRKIVINCYKFHGREDLLPAFSEEDEKANQLATLNSSVASSHVSAIRNVRFSQHFFSEKPFDFYINR